MATKKKVAKKAAKKTARKAVKKVTKRVTKKPAKKAVTKRKYTRKPKPTETVVEVEPIQAEEQQVSPGTATNSADPEDWGTVNTGSNNGSCLDSVLRSINEQVAADMVVQERLANPVGATLFDLDEAADQLDDAIFELGEKLAPYTNLLNVPTGNFTKQPIDGLTPIHTRLINLVRQIEQAKVTVQNLTKATLV